MSDENFAETNVKKVHNNFHNNNNRNTKSALIQSTSINTSAESSSSPPLSSSYSSPTSNNKFSMFNSALNSSPITKFDHNNKVSNKSSSSVVVVGMNRSSESLIQKIDENIVDENILCFDESLTFEQFTLIEHSYSKPKKALKLSKRLRKDKHRIKSKLLKNKKSSDKKHKKKKFRQNNNNNPSVSIIEETKIKTESSEINDSQISLDSKIGILENSQNISTSAIAENSIMNDKDISSCSINSEANVSASGRIQRTRKKPKRWDNDELEVDFSGGKLNITTNTQDDSKTKRDEPPVKKAKKLDKPKLIIVESSKIKKEEVFVKEEEMEESDEDSVSDKNIDHSSDDDENDSNFDSDDDPEKLWCICRQPYDDRFMIGCDLCEEWFHGKCVNVTKVQGRKMEKLGEDWYCPSCREDLNKGIPKEELKERKIEEKKALELAEKEKRLQKNKAKLLEKARIRKDSSSKHSSVHDDDDDSVIHPKQSKSSRHSISRSNSSKIESKKEKEEEEKRRLKKLIKASKKDLNEKREKLKSNEQTTTTINHSTESMDNELKYDHPVNNNNNNDSQHDTSNSSTSFTNNNSFNSDTEFSKVFVIQKHSKQNDNNNLNKKKHKIDPIDQSVQDLFKAEPAVLMRSLSSSSSTSSSVATTPAAGVTAAINTNQLSPNHQQRKTSVHIDSRRTSISSSSNDNIACPNVNNCGGKIQQKINSSESIKSIYCNQDCLQTHVNDVLKALRSLKRMKDKMNLTTPSQSLKVILIDRLNNDRKDNIKEKDVLDFIRANQTFEIHKPSALRKSSNTGPNTSTANILTNKTATLSSSAKSPPTSKVSNETSTKNKQAQSSSTIKLERTSSVSSDTSNDNRNESRRQYVRNTINEILKSRYKEMTIDEKATISSFSEITKLSVQIENELFKVFKVVNSKYQTKSRSLIFNLRDTKNTLFRKVLLGKVSPERLVNMSPEELASAELSRWREHEKKTMIQLITRDAFDQANQVIVKKTHKGEEFIENDLVLDLPSTEIAANNEKAPLNDSNQTDSESNMSNLLESPVKEAPVSLTSGPQENNDSSLLDILDTTSQHSAHVYSSNCKICTQNSSANESIKLEKDNISNVSMMPPTSPVAKTSKEIDSPTVQRLQPKRVRVENESFNEFLKEAEKKLSDKILMEIQHSITTTVDTQSSNDIDKSITTNDMNSTKSSQQSPLSSSKETSHDKNSDTNGNKISEHKTSKPVWKGTIFMQDVAKFVATAQVITGNAVEVKYHLRHDYVEQITVCGRIAPEQALDYIEKLKISKHSEIVLIRFIWSSREERTGYDAFFHYLKTRNRLGVVYLKHSTTGYKDFYILPLSQNSDIPEILLPSNNSVNLIGEIGKKNHRPNLLLGILIKTRKSNNNISQLSTNISQSIQQNDSPSVNERSYTPPLSSNVSSTTPPYHDPDDGSYTPPPLLHSTPKISDGSKKIGHHHQHHRSENKSLINQKHDLTKSSNHDEEKLSDMIEKVSSSSNPIEMTASILNAIVETDNLELQGKLLSKLQAKVEDKLQHTIQNNTELNVCHSNMDGTTASMPTNIMVPTSSSLSFDNLIPNIKNIQLPDNLKDILRTVQDKTAQVADAQRMIDGGNMNSSYIINSSNVDHKNIQQNNVSFNDPRLRQSVSTQPVAASMSKDELLQKAQEQMAALAQMEYQQQNPSQQTINTRAMHQHHQQEPMIMAGGGRIPSTSIAGYHANQANEEHSPGMSNRKISFQWKKKK